MTNNYGVEVELKKEPWKIQEVLCRIGIGRLSDQTLWPSCHLIKQEERYFIMHFKEAMMSEGSKAELVEGDIPRRNKIVSLLEKWNMVSVSPNQDISDQIEHVFVLRASDSKDWNIKPKYYPLKKK